MNIAGKSYKEILIWVLKNGNSGFNRADLKNGLKLNSNNDVEKILGFLKQPLTPNSAYIITHDNSGQYFMTSKVVSELNSLKPWYDKLIGKIIIGVMITIIATILLKYAGSILNEIKIRLF
jgi:hypothetical protein